MAQHQKGNVKQHDSGLGHFPHFSLGLLCKFIYPGTKKQFVLVFLIPVNVTNINMLYISPFPIMNATIVPWYFQGMWFFSRNTDFNRFESENRQSWYQCRPTTNKYFFLFLPQPITSLISDINISGRLDQIIDLHLRLSHILVTYLTSLLASPRSFPVEEATARIKSRFLPDVNRHNRLIMSLGVLEASALSSVCEVIGRNT